MAEEETTGQEFNLRNYYYILIKRKRLVILLTVLGLLLTIIHTFVQTPQYQATTSVLIERESTVSNMAMGNEVFVQRYDYYTFFNTQYQLITSKTVAKRVVDLLDLTDFAAVYSEKMARRMAERWMRRLSATG